MSNEVAKGLARAAEQLPSNTFFFIMSINLQIIMAHKLYIYINKNNTCYMLKSYR